MRKIITVLALCTSVSLFADVPRKDCFPIEHLPAPLRPLAETLLLKIMDSEGLYTLIGGIKPTSSGWLMLQYSVEQPELTKAEDMRKCLQAIRCGDEITSALQPFYRIYEGRRSLDGYIFHKQAMAKCFDEYAWFWKFYGVTPSSNPLEALTMIEVDATPRRNRGYGYLFGYPKYAVDFFVESEEHKRKTNEFVKRDFLSVPVFSGPDHRFVYAVPKGHQVNDDDLTLRKKAEPILTYYRKLRPKYIGKGKPGIVALLRDWYDDGKGRCSSLTAFSKATKASLSANR